MEAPKIKKDHVRAYYESEANEYDRQFYLEDSSYPTLRYRHNYILDMVDSIVLPSNARILDIGCGPGEMVIDLIKDEREIHGIDIAEEMIALAKGRLKQKQNISNEIVLGVGDIENLDYPDQFFDLIIISGVVEYLKDDVNWIEEMKRVINPEGYIIVNVTNKYSIRKWTSEWLEKLKSLPSFYKVMNFIKSKILNKGKLHHFPFTPRLHSPKQFDKFMFNHGFKKIRHNYFDFAILPYPFDTLFGIITTPLKKYLERFSQKNMTINGTGYIVLVKKSK